MSLNPVSSSMVTQRLLGLRQELDALQRQLGTGRRSETYRDLGPNRSVALNARGRMDDILAFKSNIETVNIRLNIVQTTLERFSDIAVAQRDDNKPQLLPSDGSYTSAQKNAELRLDEIFSLMNQDINGRHMFSGRATDTDAVAPLSQVLDGTTNLIGLRDVIEERRRADMGTGNLGRLTIDNTTPGITTLSEVNGVAFGFKIGAASSTLSNATVTRNSGPPPDVDVAFTGLPSDGERVSITLNLPDGTSTTLTLTATDGAPSDGEFAIGVDAATTATNLTAALSSELQRLSQTNLRPASAIKASNDFFNVSASQAPQRVNITSTPEEATSLRDGDDYGPAVVVATNQAEILGNTGNGSAIVAADSTLYSFTVNTGSGPQLVSFTSGVGATQNDIITGLLADFAANVPGAGVSVEAVANDAGTGIRVRALNADTDITIGAGAGNSGLTAAAYPSTSLFDRVVAAGGGSGNTLTINVNGGGPQTITFGTGVGQVSTIAELNAALGGLTGVTASISGTTLNLSTAGAATQPTLVVTGSSAGLRTALGLTSISGVTQTGALPTVVWYTGDDANDDARATGAIRADTSLTLGYGMRATESGFRQLISNLAAFASVNFDPNVAHSQNSYNTLAAKVRDNIIDNGSQGIGSIQVQLAAVQTSMKAASERHTDFYAFYENVVDSVESISKEEVATLILELQTRLEASYQVTANLSQLSLVKYI